MAGLNVGEGLVDDGLLNLDFNRICRLCLNFCRDYVDLRPSDENQDAPRHIIDQIKYCYCIKIDLTEPLPSKVCLQCVQILTLLCATKRNIKYSELMLRNILTLRNARHSNNTENGQGANLSILQRLLSEGNQGGSSCPDSQDRPALENGQVQNSREKPIQTTTSQEHYQNQALQDSDNKNLPTQMKTSQSTAEHTERSNVENQNTNIDNSDIEKKNEDKENVGNKSLEMELEKSSHTNSDSGESSSNGSSCSSSTDSKLPEKNDSEATKTVEEEKRENTNKKPNLVQNTNKRKLYEIDMKRDLRVKLEVLDLNKIKFCSLNINGLNGSTEGRGGRPSGESSSGKVVKEIGTNIDTSNILSPKAKRMRKSIPKRSVNS